LPSRTAIKLDSIFGKLLIDMARTRPLCVFPNLAKYKGVGSTANAANWTCEKGLVNDATEDADAVLPDRGDRDRDDRSGDHD
jgi:hypothetical protein